MNKEVIVAGEGIKYVKETSSKNTGKNKEEIPIILSKAVHMSTKLQIRIKKLIDPEFDLKLDYGELVRLPLLIQFKTKSGWSELYECIIDTGSHTSVIPEYI